MLFTFFVSTFISWDSDWMIVNQWEWGFLFEQTTFAGTRGHGKVDEGLLETKCISTSAITQGEEDLVKAYGNA